LDFAERGLVQLKRREGLRLLKEREEVKQLRLAELRNEIAVGAAPSGPAANLWTGRRPLRRYGNNSAEATRMSGPKKKNLAEPSRHSRLSCGRCPALPPA
jgi:hypothetical protein